MTQRHPIQNEARMFVTTNASNRQRLFEHPVYAREAIDCLYRVQVLFPFFLYGFVIMPDHCHFLLMVPAPMTIAAVIHSYKRAVSHAIGKGPLWQPRFDLRIPDDSLAVLRYIHCNPVKAGLVDAPEDYPWSSACGRWDVQDL